MIHYRLAKQVTEHDHCSLPFGKPRVRPRHGIGWFAYVGKAAKLGRNEENCEKFPGKLAAPPTPNYGRGEGAPTRL